MVQEVVHLTRPVLTLAKLVDLLVPVGRMIVFVYILGPQVYPEEGLRMTTGLNVGVI